MHGGLALQTAVLKKSPEADQLEIWTKQRHEIVDLMGFNRPEPPGFLVVKTMESDLTNKNDDLMGFNGICIYIYYIYIYILVGGLEP